VSSGKARARLEAGQTSGLLLPDLQLVQEQERLGAAVRLIDVEQKLAVCHALDGAVGPVAITMGTCAKRIE